MKAIIVAIMLSAATSAHADKTLQCERYTVEETEPSKQDRSIFTFTFSTGSQSVIYKKISGPDWFIPSGTILKPVWKSEDDLRVVVSWINSDYGKVGTVWHPLYILDVDFKIPRYKLETYGGFSDFAEEITCPWKQECMRLD